MIKAQGDSLIGTNTIWLLLNSAVAAGTEHCPPGEELSASRGHVIGGQHLLLLPNPYYPASPFPVLPA